MTRSGTRAGRGVAAHWPAIRARGRGRFVLVRGLALRGGLMFLAVLAMTGLRLGIDHPRYPLLAAIALPLCAIGGIAWGLLTWTLNDRLYRMLQP